MIYGSALIAFCMITGTIIGDLLGKLIGIDSNIGGVGFSMLILIILTNYVFPDNKMKENTKKGLLFWQGMYIPVTVAMAASQNAVQAVTGGPVAILAGLGAVMLGFIALPLLGKIGGKYE